MPKQLTYEQWLKANPDIAAAEEDCINCNSTGRDTCHCCGNDIDCEECGGIGKINSARKLYEAQLERDEGLWHRVVETQKIIVEFQQST